MSKGNPVMKWVLLPLLIIGMLFAQEETAPKEDANAADEFNAIEELSKIELVSHDGKTVETSKALEGKQLIALYFSARWSDEGKDFSPELVQFKNNCRQNKNAFEVVFISWDKSQSEMYGYMKDAGMDWPAIPYDNPLIKEFYRQFKVENVPRLVILDEKGKVISKDGRWDVHLLGLDAYKQWQASDYKSLTFEDAERLNRKKTEKTAVEAKVPQKVATDTPKTTEKSVVKKSNEKNSAGKKSSEKTVTKKSSEKSSSKKKAEKSSSKKKNEKSSKKEKEKKKKDKKKKDKKDKDKDKD